MLSLIPSKAPPQMNRIFFVFIVINELVVLITFPMAGNNILHPSISFRRAACVLMPDAGYAYITRDKSKDEEKLAKREHFKQWMKTHKSFGRVINDYAFEIEVKGSWAPDDRVNAALVKKVLKDLGYEIDFTAGELLRVWRNW